MSIDFTDGTLFGNDAGEDEVPDILNSYFVDQSGFQAFLSRRNNFRVARSRKGMGKSALLSKLAYDLEQEADKPIVIKITGSNLIGIIPLDNNYNHLQMQNYWFRVIISRINIAIGSHFNFRFSDRTDAIVDQAEITDLSNGNMTKNLLSRISRQKILIESEVNGQSQDLSGLFSSPPEKEIWLLVDDIDSTYVNTPELQLFTSTFFSACRAIVRDTKGLSIRASVRTDVWSNLTKNEDLDKCEQYVIDITWSPIDMNVILSKKVYSYIRRNDPQSPVLQQLDYRKDAGAVLELAFERRIRWGDGMVPPFRPVYILSAGRPRWMSQLCRFAGKQASKTHKSLIGTPEINAVSKTYSQFRLSDIYKEHAHQFADLQKLIEAFSNTPALYATNDLLSQLSSNYTNYVGAGNIPPLDGYPYTRPLQLAHFIYKIGFILGRREQSADTSTAEFVRYEERPDLLNEARNPDDGLFWEVHPAYRSALSIGRAVRVARGAKKARHQKDIDAQKPVSDGSATPEVSAKPPHRRRHRGGSRKNKSPVG